jgi:hypothetical protein
LKEHSLIEMLFFLLILLALVEGLSMELGIENYVGKPKPFSQNNSRRN